MVKSMDFVADANIVDCVETDFNASKFLQKRGRKSVRDNGET